MTNYGIIYSVVNDELVEILNELGQPPQGVSLETYAIAEVEPKKLTMAAREISPTYEQLKRIDEENPDLFRHLTENPQPEWRLGENILLKQQRLSKPRRLATTLLASLALATGSGAMVYETKENIRQDFPELRDKKPIKEAVGVGGVVGTMSGFAIYPFTFLFSHRLARPSARKIVRQAEKEST